jgi:hypothetical protein
MAELSRSNLEKLAKLLEEEEAKASKPEVEAPAIDVEALDKDAALKAGLMEPTKVETRLARAADPEAKEKVDKASTRYRENRGDELIFREGMSIGAAAAQVEDELLREKQVPKERALEPKKPIKPGPTATVRAMGRAALSPRVIPLEDDEMTPQERRRALTEEVEPEFRDLGFFRSMERAWLGEEVELTAEQAAQAGLDKDWVHKIKDAIGGEVAGTALGFLSPVDTMAQVLGFEGIPGVQSFQERYANIRTGMQGIKESDEDISHVKIGDLVDRAAAKAGFEDNKIEEAVKEGKMTQEEADAEKSLLHPSENMAGLAEQVRGLKSEEVDESHVEQLIVDSASKMSAHELPKAAGHRDPTASDLMKAIKKQPTAVDMPSIVPILEAIRSGDEAKADDLLRRLPYADMPETLRAEVEPGYEQIAQAVEGVNRVFYETGGASTEALMPILGSALMTRAGGDVYVESTAGRVMRGGGLLQTAVLEMDVGTPMGLVAGAVRSLTPRFVADTVDPILEAAEQVRLPTPAGIDYMLASEDLGPLVQDVLGIENYDRIRDPESTWFSRTMAKTYSGDQGLVVDLPDIAEAAGMDSDSPWMTDLKVAGLAADFLVPWEGYAARPVMAPAGRVYAGVKAARMVPHGPRLPYAFAAAVPEVYALKHTNLDADAPSVHGHILSNHVGQSAYQGKNRLSDLPKSARDALDDVVSMVTDPVRARTQFEARLRENRLQYMGNLDDIMENSSLDARTLRESEGYKAFDKEIKVLVVDGLIPEGKEPLVRGLFEIEAHKVAADPEIPDIQSPEDFFDLWRLEREAGPRSAAREGELFQEDTGVGQPLGITRPEDLPAGRYPPPPPVGIEVANQPLGMLDEFEFNDAGLPVMGIESPAQIGKKNALSSQFGVASLQSPNAQGLVRFRTLIAKAQNRALTRAEADLYNLYYGGKPGMYRATSVTPGEPVKKTDAAGADITPPNLARNALEVDDGGTMDPNVTAADVLSFLILKGHGSELLAVRARESSELVLSESRIKSQAILQDALRVVDSNSPSGYFRATEAPDLTKGTVADYTYMAPDGTEKLMVADIRFQSRGLHPDVRDGFATLVNRMGLNIEMEPGRIRIFPTEGISKAGQLEAIKRIKRYVDDGIGEAKFRADIVAAAKLLELEPEKITRSVALDWHQEHAVRVTAVRSLDVGIPEEGRVQPRGPGVVGRADGGSGRGLPPEVRPALRAQAELEGVDGGGPEVVGRRRDPAETTLLAEDLDVIDVTGQRPAPEAPVAPAPMFFSKLRREVDAALGAAKAIKASSLLAKLKKKVKAEELEFTGMEEYLREAGQERVSVDDVRQFIEANETRLTETELGGAAVDGGYQKAVDKVEALRQMIAQDKPRNQRIEEAIDGFPERLGAEPKSRDLRIDLLKEARRFSETEGNAMANFEPSPELMKRLKKAVWWKRGELWDEDLPPAAPDPIYDPVEAVEVMIDHAALRADFYVAEKRLSEMDGPEFAAAPRYETWTVPGGENYRETLLRLPGEDAYQSPHWDQPNVLAHIRMDDRVGPSGEKILFVQEIQSDWHQAGREVGYTKATPAELKAIDAMEKRISSAVKEAGQEVSDIKGDLRSELRGAKLPSNSIDKLVKLINSPEDVQAVVVGDKVVVQQPEGPNALPITVEFGIPHQIPEAFKAVELINKRRVGHLEAVRDYRKVYDELIEFRRSPEHQAAFGVSDAPFKTTWHQVAIKRVLREATEQGYDKVQFTTGEAIQSIVGGLEGGQVNFYDKVIPNFLGKYTKKYGAKVYREDVPGSFIKGRTPDPDIPSDEPYGDINAVNGYTVDVTPEMKAEVLGKGQELFQRKGKGLDEGKARGSFRPAINRKGIKYLISMFDQGDIGTLFHENGHLMRHILGGSKGEEMARVFDHKVLPDGTVEFTKLGEEQAAYSFEWFMKTRTATGGRMQRAFKGLFVDLQEVWNRSRGQVQLNRGMKQFWDGYFQPSQAFKREAISLTNRGKKRFGRVTVSLDPEEMIKKAKPLKSGQAKEFGSVDMTPETLAKVLDMEFKTVDGKRVLQPKQMDVIEFYQRLTNHVVAEQTRWKFGGKIQRLTPRTVVPLERISRIKRQVRERLTDANIDPSQFETFSKTIPDPRSAPDSGDTLSISMLRLNDGAAAGLEDLVDEFNDSPLGNALPPALTNKLVEKSPQWNEVEATDLNAVIDVLTDDLAGVASHRSRKGEAASSLASHWVAKGFTTSADFLETKLGIQAVGSVRASLKKNFTVPKFDAGYANPLAAEIFQRGVRKLNSLPDWMMRGAKQLKKESPIRGAADLIDGLRKTLTPPVDPGSAPLLVRWGDKLSAKSAKPLMLKDIDEDFVSQVKSIFKEGGRITPDEEAALRMVNGFVVQRRKAGKKIDIPEDQKEALSQALLDVELGLTRRWQTFDAKLRDLVFIFSGSKGAQAEKLFASIGNQSRLELYEAFFNPKSTVPFQDVLQWMTRHNLETGLRFNTKYAMTQAVARMRGLEIMSEMTEELTRHGFMMDVAEEAKQMGIKVKDRSGFVDRVNHYLNVEAGFATQRVFEAGEELVGEAGEEAVVAAPRLARDVPGPFGEAKGRPTKGTGDQFNIQDMDAYLVSQKLMAQWGWKRGAGEWEKYRFPTGEEILIPSVLKDSMADTIDRAIAAGGAYGKLDPDKISAIGKFLNTIWKHSPLTYSRIKMGVTTGIFLPNPAYYMANVMGGVLQVYQGLGMASALKAGAGLLADPFRMAVGKPSLTGSVVARMWGDGTYKPTAKPLITDTGKIYTSEMLADMAQAEGLRSSYILAETARNIAEEFRDMEPTFWNKMMEKPRAWQDTLIEGATAIDNYYRVGTFVDSLKVGKSPTEAAELARTVAYDYSHLSDFERTWMRKLFMFYSYTRRNIDLTWHTLLTNPHRIAGQLRLIHGIQNEFMETESELTLRDWQKTRLPVAIRDEMVESHTTKEPHPNSHVTSATMWLGPPTPAADSLTIYMDLMDIIGSYSGKDFDEEALRHQLARLNPYVRMGFELAFNKLLFEGRPLDTHNRIPPWFMEIDRNMTGGRVVDDLLQAQWRPDKYPEKQDVPGSGMWHAKSGKTWWMFRNILQTPGFGRSQDTITWMDRANMGAVEGFVNASRSLNRAFDIEDAKKDRKEVVTARTEGIVPGEVFEEDVVTTRPGMSTFDELLGWIGFKGYAIPKEDAAVARHRKDQQRQIEDAAAEAKKSEFHKYTEGTLLPEDLSPGTTRP